MAVLKRIFLILIITYLGIFYIQKKSKLASVKPLDGTKEYAIKPKFEIKNFFNGTYQDSLNTYENENTGFRPSLVRLYNSISFNLLHTTKAPGVVIGKKGQFFIESYINNFIGINFIGKQKADENVRKIKFVQNSFKSFGIDLIIIFAPGKASFYPDYIPDSYLIRKKDSTNYNYYSKKFYDVGINFIDFNKYYCDNKNTFSYPIYPEYGTHWTPYGSAVAMDSIIHYIEAKRNIHLPIFDYSTVLLKKVLKEREYDIGILLNLPKILPHKPMPYPDFRYKYEKGQVKPDVLVVGDSYWWCMVGDDIPYHVFKKDEYWFYNRDIYKRNSRQDKGVNEISFPNETVGRDVIILMATEATFDLFPYGFIDKAYDIYCLSIEEKRKLIAKKISGDPNWKKNIIRKAKENKITEKEQFEKDVDFVLASEYTPTKTGNSSLNEIIREIEEKIKKDLVWMEQIKKKADENQITMEDQLNQDAMFIYESEYGSTEVKQVLKDIRNRISADSVWMISIKEKAKNKNITIEEMLELDAKYIYDTEVLKKK